MKKLISAYAAFLLIGVPWVSNRDTKTSFAHQFSGRRKFAAKC